MRRPRPAGQARTGYLPRLAIDGSFTATVRHFDGVERWTFSLLPQLVQTVYGGGAVRAAARQAELGYGIALCDRGVFAPRRALCRRLRLLEPLGRGTLCRLDAAVCRDHPFAQGGRRPPLFGGLYRQGRRADDRRTVERGRIFARERRAELRGCAPTTSTSFAESTPRSAYSSRRASATRCRCPDGSWRPRRWSGVPTMPPHGCARSRPRRESGPSARRSIRS